MNYKRVFFDQARRLGWRFPDRKELWFFCAAEFVNRTNAAFRLARNTDKCPEIHQCGVVGSGAEFWNKTRGISPKRLPARVEIKRLMKVEKSRQNAGGIRFNDRNCLIKHESRNGVSSILSNAWQLLHLLDGSRKAAAISSDNRLRGGVKIPRTSVIPEALPAVQDVVFRGTGQRSEIRKPLNPAFVEWDNGGDLSLLKHELRDENSVRIASTTPRKMATIMAIPAQKSALERANIFRRCHGLNANVQHPTLNVQLSIQKMIER